jgi:hypothetical protein
VTVAGGRRERRVPGRRDVECFGLTRRDPDRRAGRVTAAFLFAGSAVRTALAARYASTHGVQSWNHSSGGLTKPFTFGLRTTRLRSLQMGKNAASSSMMILSIWR